MEIFKEFTFEAAHQLPWHAGKCAGLHGHGYRLGNWFFDRWLKRVEASRSNEVRP